MRAKKELVEYIDKELKRGVHIDRVKSELYGAGHKVEHVDAAAEHVVGRKRMKTSLFVVMVIISVGILLVVGYKVMNRNDMGDTKSTTTTTERPTTVTNDRNMYSRALQTGDVRYCERIMDGTMKTECLRLKYILNITVPPQEIIDGNTYKRALDTGNPALCNDIKGLALRDVCLNVVR